MPDDEKLERPLSFYFNEALNYAATLHRTQARKGTQIPYVSHLLAVAGLVMSMGVTRTRSSRLCSTMPSRTRGATTSGTRSAGASGTRSSTASRRR
jgi:hypothetical protein